MVDKYREFKLKEPLSQYIDCVWMEEYSQLPENRDKTFLVAPDNTVELIFTRGLIERKIRTANSSTQLLGSHLAGLKTIAQDVRILGGTELSVRFKPHGLYPFVGPMLHETVNQSIPIADLFGPDILVLEDQLFSTPSLPEKLRLIEQFFLDRLQRRQRSCDAVFDYLARKIGDTKGLVKIHSLASDSSVAIKTIERKFQHNLGVSPKQCGQLVRLFHALRATNRQGVSLTHVAHENGFYDQMHYIKEIKKFVRLTPGEYLKANRDLQLPIFTR